MKNHKSRRFSTWEWLILATPIFCLLCIGLFSRLKTIELPRQQLIERGKPLFTMIIEAKPDGSFAVHHAVRTLNGTYKIYSTQQSEPITQR